MITPVLPKDRYAELFWSVGKYVSIVNVYICSISGKMLTLEGPKCILSYFLVYKQGINVFGQSNNTLGVNDLRLCLQKLP